MNFERYIRQTTLKGFGSEGQEKLSGAKVLVVGAGGLGVPVLQYLNAMGVGTLGVVDNDTVDLANLQRQVIYDENDIGKRKTEIALKKLKAQNSKTRFLIFDTFLEVNNAEEIIDGFDIVIDATDNFPTRYLVNDVCVMNDKPFIYGALHGFEGQVSVFNYKGGPTYRCLFPEMPSAEDIPDCNVNGVLGVIPGIIGNFQALEAVKLITGVGEVLSGKLLIYDGLTQQIQHFKFPLNPENLEIMELQESYDANSESKTIGSAEFYQRLNSEENLQVIDVRNPEEFSRFHLEKSVNIPLLELEERASEIIPEKEIYVVCQSGIRSQKAIQVLNKFNLPQLIGVEGGINQIKKYVPGAE